MTIDQISQIVHDVIRAYNISIEDDSDLPWEEVSGEQRNTIRNAVLLRVTDPDAVTMSNEEYMMLPHFKKTKEELFRQIVRSLTPYLEY